MIKSFTDLEQSKKLAEILPLESADMCYSNDGTAIKIDANPYLIRKKMWQDYVVEVISCWSLAALLGVLPKIINNETLFIETSAALWHVGYRNVYTARADNPVDACYELILKLHELKLL